MCNIYYNPQTDTQTRTRVCVNAALLQLGMQVGLALSYPFGGAGEWV